MLEVSEIILVFVGFISLIILLYLLIKKDINQLLGSLIICFLIYSLTPLILLNRLDTVRFYSNSPIYNLNFSEREVLYSSISILVGLISILIGYFIFSKDNKKIVYYLKSKDILYYTNICFLIGVFSFIIFISTRGGLINAIQTAEKYRFKPPKRSTLDFIKNFVPLIDFSFLGYFSIKNKQKKEKILLVISFIISILYYLISAGRKSFILFFIVPFLANLDIKRKINIKNLFIIFLGSLIFFMYSDFILKKIIGLEDSFSLNKTKIIYVFFADFGFPYMTLLMSFKTNITRYFLDTIYGLINLIPYRILEVIGLNKMESLFSINTMNFKSEKFGHIPVDLISYGNYSFGIVGVILCCFLYGKMINRMDKIFNSRNYFFIVMKYKFLVSSSFFIMYSDPSMFLITAIPLLGTYFFIEIKKMKRGKQ